MIDYGSAPAADEIEVSLFGPGYGEAIAVHLGDGVWLLVDSCIDPESKQPASETYLDQIRVQTNQVRTILASHWHDDHVRGISKLVSKYPSADLVISSVFKNKEASTFLRAFNGDSPKLSRGTKELFSAVKAKAQNNLFHAHHKQIVLEDNFNNRPVMVTALSPMSTALSQSIAQLAQHLPNQGDPINHVPEIKPNLEAIVLHIDLGNDAILLGSDLEEHAKFGWSAVIADQWSGNRKSASAYKVAHHGSKTGECPKIWNKLLRDDAIASLTPWILGGKRLPSEEDKQRLKKKVPQVYIASASSRTPQMDSRQLKRLNDIAKNVLLVDSGFGVVRLRKKINTQSWNTELFGAAQKL